MIEVMTNGDFVDIYHRKCMDVQDANITGVTGQIFYVK